MGMSGYFLFIYSRPFRSLLIKYTILLYNHTKKERKFQKKFSLEKKKKIDKFSNEIKPKKKKLT